MQSRGRTFLQEIRDAIEASDRVVAVLGPMALSSEYVRSEWEHALLFCKGVLPVLRKGEFLSLQDPDHLCREIARLHTVDFRPKQGNVFLKRSYRKSFAELLRLLREAVPPLGPLRNLVPSLPPHFLQRREDLDRLDTLMLGDVQRPVVINSAIQSTALQGMGGIGKSVLAAAFARSAHARQAFTDGIVWVTVGLDAVPLDCARRVGLALSGASGEYASLELASVKLPGLLADKVCLLVLDDVWDVAQAALLRNALGPRCRLLLTTRNGVLVTALGAQEHRLDVLSENAALTLLADWSGCRAGELPAEARDVAEECGYLPLALALCGALARDGDAWTDIRKAFQNADLVQLQILFPDYPYPNVLKAFQVRMDALKNEDIHAMDCYRALAVFPPDAIPESAVVMWWLYERPTRDYEARKLLATLERKALLRLNGDAPERRMSLHNLQYNYLQGLEKEQLQGLQERLLASYAARCSDGWPTGPNDGYFFERLPWHLKAARRTAELKELLCQFKWLNKKLEITDPNALVADYDHFAEEEDMRLIQSALRLSANVLTRDKRQLPGQLTGRLLGSEFPAVSALLRQTAAWNGWPWLQPMIASMTPAGGHLVRVLEGHANWVHTLAVTVDGSYAVSGGYDDVLRIWDLETGRTVNTLTGHTGPIHAVAVSYDSSRVISASADGTLRVWNFNTGKAISIKACHRGGTHAMATTPNPDHIVWSSNSRTLRIWNLRTDRQVRTLRGHTALVTAVVVTGDEKQQRAISASEDKTLRVWDLTSGESLCMLTGHTDRITAVAVTPDGERAISASRDETLRVWTLKDLNRVKTVCVLQGHAGPVETVAITPDGRVAISGGWDRNLRIWDLETGRFEVLEGHTQSVHAVALIPKRPRPTAISGSDDYTLRMWDLATSKVTPPLKTHTEEVSAVTVTPDGRLALSASGDKSLNVWDVKTRQIMFSLKGHTGWVTAVAATPDSQSAISASGDQTLRGWNLETGKPKWILRGHTDWVTAVSITTDGRLVISASDDRTLRVWSLETGLFERKLERHTEPVKAVAAVPKKRRAVSGGTDQLLRLWDLDADEPVRTLSGHTAWIRAVAVTPDGQSVISAGDDQLLRIWNLENGQPEGHLRGHTDSVIALAITHDGRRVLSASKDYTLRLWDLKTKTEIVAFIGESPISSCAIAPNHQTIIAGDKSGFVHILKLILPE
jgi:WD40 repeat protein